MYSNMCIAYLRAPFERKYDNDLRRVKPQNRFLPLNFTAASTTRVGTGLYNTCMPTP